MADMKYVKKFWYDKDTDKYTDSMLFDSGTVIATMEYEDENRHFDFEFKVMGMVDVVYKDEHYYRPSEFPPEVIEKIKNQTIYDYGDDGDPDGVYILYNNWFGLCWTLKYKNCKYEFDDDDYYERDIVGVDDRFFIEAMFYMIDQYKDKYEGDCILK